MSMQVGAGNGQVFRNFYSTAVKASPIVKSPIVQQCNNSQLTQSTALSGAKSSFWSKLGNFLKIKQSVAAGATAGIAAGQIFKKNAITPYIKFKPAKSVKEAKLFGKKYLGVESYKDIDNLDMLNYVNEGLWETTRATKGKAVMPNCIKGLTKDGELSNSPLSAVTKKSGERILEINKRFFKKVVDKNLKKTYKEMLKKGYLTKKGSKYYLALRARSGQKALMAEKTINKLFNSNKELTINEKMSLTRLCDNMTGFSANNIRTNSPIAAIRNICDGTGKDSFVLNGIKYSIADIERMDIKSQGILLESMLQNGMKYDFVQNPTCYVAHEVGHFQHANDIGFKQYHELTDIQCKTKKDVSRWNKQGVNLLQGRINQQMFKNNPEKQAIAAEVSERAMESPLEFVSEVYSKLLERKTFSQRVMNMFKEYGGTVPYPMFI